jgi:hypothetical protein
VRRISLGHALPPRSFIIEVNPCPPRFSGLVTCNVNQSVEGVSAVLPQTQADVNTDTGCMTHVIGSGNYFTLISASGYEFSFTADQSSSAFAPWALRPVASLYCELTAKSSTVSLAEAYFPIVTVPAAWPFFSDVVLTPPTGVMRSAMNNQRWNATSALISSVCPGQTSRCAASTVITPASVSEVLQQSYDTNLALPVYQSGSSVNQHLSITINAGIVLTLVATSSFDASMIVFINGVQIESVDVSTSLRFASFVIPESVDLCPMTVQNTTSSGCGYVRIALANPSLSHIGTLIEQLEALPDVPANLVAASFNANFASGTGRRLVGAVGAGSLRTPFGGTVLCPPFCPGMRTDVFPQMQWQRNPARSSYAFSNNTTPNGSVIRYEVADSRLGVGYLPRDVEDVAVFKVEGLSDQSDNAIYVADVCTEGFEDTANGNCLNISDPRHRLCPFGEPPACQFCPEGALCPGGKRAWPLQGYYSSSESSANVQECFQPQFERCRGWDMTQEALLCGLAYDNPTIGCLECASGYFATFDGVCVSCPEGSAVANIAKALGVLVGSVGVMVLVMYVIIRVAQARIGGTLEGGWQRFISFAA